MTQTEHQTEPRIRFAKVDSICIYQITESELSALEEGSPGSTYLNLAIFFTSTAIGFLVSLLLTKIEPDRLFTVFVVVTVGGFIAGSILFCLWIKACMSTTPVAKKIRERDKKEASDIKAIEANQDPTSTIGSSASPSGHVHNHHTSHSSHH